MLRTILIVIAAGVGSYFGVQAMGTKVPLSSGTGDIYLAQGDKTVTPSLAPLAQGDKKVPRNLAPVTSGDSSGDSGSSSDGESSVPATPIPPAPTPWPSVPSVTPRPVVTPEVTPDAPDPTPWPEPEATESPDSSPSPIPTPEPTPDPIVYSVVINEIAWMGTATSSADEWIELFNFGVNEVDLGGWTLSSTDTNKTPNIALSGVISPGGYYLLERTNDETISDILANLIYTGGLSNGGEVLILQDSAGNTVDTVGSQPWINENGEISRKQDISSLERISAELPGNEASNWASNDGSVTVGSDAGGLPIKGTPGYKNSVSQ